MITCIKTLHYFFKCISSSCSADFSAIRQVASTVSGGLVAWCMLQGSRNDGGVAGHPALWPCLTGPTLFICICPNWFGKTGWKKNPSHFRHWHVVRDGTGQYHGTGQYGTGQNGTEIWKMNRSSLRIKQVRYRYRYRYLRSRNGAVSYLRLVYFVLQNI